MNILLDRTSSWTVGALATLACAALAARGSVHLLEARAVELGGGAPAEPAPRAAPASADPGRAGKGLGARNMFCVACEPPEAPAPARTAAGIPATQLPLELVATGVSLDRRRSFATIRDTDTQRQGAYWDGETIPGAGDIVRIAGAYVEFHNGAAGRLERIPLAGTSPAAAPAPERPEPARAQRRVSRPAGAERSVAKTGPRSYEIDRAFVDKALANPARLARGVRIRPAAVDGEPRGFELAAVRRGSAVAAIGLARGDTITSVNGFELTTPDKVLEVVSKVRTARHLSLTAIRDGEPITLKYTIR